MPNLVIIQGKDKGKRFNLEPGQTFRIGRRTDNDLPLKDSSLSRHHCEILFDGNRTSLLDKGSRHGTFLNGKAVREIVLNHGDQIRIGKTIIQVELDTESSQNSDKPQEIVHREEDLETKDAQHHASSEDDNPFWDIEQRERKTWIVMIAVAVIGVLLGIITFLFWNHRNQAAMPKMTPIEQPDE